MIELSKRTRLLLVLSAIFITSAITAELISSKLFIANLNFGWFNLGSYVSIVGIIPWPVVFLTTDTINEFYGPKVVRTLSIITCFMIAFCFVIVFIAMDLKAFVPPQPNPPPAGWHRTVASDEEFNHVFGQSQWIIVGSITAFLIGQLVDSFVFWFFRKRTGGKMIWLRSTGSTVISQLIDTFVVLYIGLVLPGSIQMKDYWTMGITNYIFKLLIAIGLTPLIYLLHWMVEKYIGKAEAKAEEEEIAQEVAAD